MGKSADALGAYRQARADQEALAAVPEASNDARRDLADTINRIGLLLWSTGELAEAEAAHRKALEIRQELADDNPAVTEFRSSLAGSHNNLAIVLSDTSKPAEAEAEFHKALALRQKLADDNPAVTEFRHRLADSHHLLGIRLWNTGKPAEAEAEYRKSLELRQKLADDNPAVTEIRSRLAMTHGGLGDLLSNTGKPAEAEAEHRKALAHCQRLVDDNPSVIEFRRGLSFGYLRVASLQAWFEQDKELSSTCDKLLSLAKDTEDAMVAERAVRCCSLRQADPKQREAALVLARRAVEHGKGSRSLVYFKMALGMAEYRSGHISSGTMEAVLALDLLADAFFRPTSPRQQRTDLEQWVLVVYSVVTNFGSG